MLSDTTRYQPAVHLSRDLEKAQSFAGLKMPALGQLVKMSGFLRDAVGLATSLNIDPAEGQPVIKLSLSKVLAGGLFGGIIYDVSGSTFGRRTAQLHTARVLSTTWVIDYLIDDFKTPHHRRVEILTQMRDTLSTGNVHTFPESRQLDAANLQIKRLQRALARVPNSKVLHQAAGDLMQGALDQIMRPPTLEVSMALGAATGRSLGIIPYGWTPDLDPRFLKALEKFGIYMQLYDDLYDVEHDRACGLKTFATEASSLTEAERMARPLAENHINEAIAVLHPHERWAMRLMRAVASRFWKPLRYYSNRPL